MKVNNQLLRKLSSQGTLKKCGGKISLVVLSSVVYPGQWFLTGVLSSQEKIATGCVRSLRQSTDINQAKNEADWKSIVQSHLTNWL